MLPAKRPIHVTKSGVVHRKKCRHPKTPADLMRRYCLVCGCKAENYNFGVISCESCKAFFRRNAHKQTLGEAGFACSFRRGGCEVTLATRKKCPGCRLAKCFAVGMQADLIQRADQLFVPPPPLPRCLDQSSTSASMSVSSSLGSFSSSASTVGSAFRPLVGGLPPPPPLQPCRQFQQPKAVPANGDEHLVRLWQRLHSPEPRLLPSSFTEPDCNQAVDSAMHRSVNVLLVDFFVELRQLVQDALLADIGAGGQSDVDILKCFVHQAAKFVSGLRQMDRLERPHLLTLLRCRLHAVLFPLSCAACCQADGKFYFNIRGCRTECNPIQLFIDLVRRSSGSQLVDQSRLMEFGTYARLLQEVTELRPELLALFCAAKLLHLAPQQDGEQITDQRMIDACCRLGERYHQHLIDSLFYYYPFEFESKLLACCRLFKWSVGFDRSLESFIHYCPLSEAVASGSGCYT